MIIKCIMSIILIIISGMMTFGLNENFKNLDENGSIVCMLLIAITYIITIIMSFDFFKELRNFHQTDGVNLKGKLDCDLEYIYKLNKKFKKFDDYRFNDNLKVNESDIYFITFNEFKKTLTVIQRLEYILVIINVKNDFTKYNNLINKQIPLMIKALKIYEKFFDNYFTLRDVLIEIPEVVLKKEQQDYHALKTKCDISKLLKIIEVEFAQCLINNIDDIFAQIDDSLVTDESLLHAMSTNKISIDDYVNSLENSLSILKRMQTDSKQKQIIGIVSQIIDYTKEISERLKKSVLNEGPSTHFVDYYLPTSCKLLEEYIKISDETLKAKIVTTFSRMIVIFEMERNKLSEKQHIDIDAELKVLNSEIDTVTLLKNER